MKGGLRISLLVWIAALAISACAVPIFRNPLTRTVFMDEDQPAGTQLIEAGAPINLEIIGDVAGENPVRVLSGGSGLFRLNPDANDELQTAVVIDRDVTPPPVNFDLPLTLTVNIEYMNSAGQTVTSNSAVLVRVTIRDRNDKPPVWIPQTPRPISEEVLQLLNGYTIIVLSVTDADSGLNAVLSFTLVSPLNRNIEVLQDGTVRFTRAITDINSDLIIPVHIIVRDGGSPQNAIPITFDVTIQNSPELPPTFTPNMYTARLQENNEASATAYNGYPVLTVQASHNSLSEGMNRIMYSFQFTPTSENFNITIINPTTFDGPGQITFTGRVDREIRPILYLIVRANEVDGNGMVASLTNVATVEITVTDVNDNAPVFLNNAANPAGNIPYIATVPESASRGHVVLDTIEAFDSDEGTNSVFEYDIQPGVPFAIGDSGILTVSGSLDFERNETYNFEIYARETQTAERRIGTATVRVMITNVNDNTPIFSESVYTLSVLEGPSTGVPIAAITAEDADKGDFGRIESYTLISAIPSPFNNESVDGRIFVRNGASTDREMVQTYHLTMVATDGGGLTATTLLLITILDVNDNKPMFVPDSFTLILMENTLYNPALTVLATDADQPDTAYSRITYSISPTQYSSIDPQSGVVTIRDLNHEATTDPDNTVLFTITATDGGGMIGTATITVTVLDNNELDPEFTSQSYSATIPEDHPVANISGLVVRATDREEGHAISYRVVSTFAGGSFFSVYPDGQIRLAHTVDYERPAERSLFFQVLAVDDALPPRTGMTQVTVTVTNVNDNAPIITDPTTQESTQLSLTEKEGTILSSVVLTVEAEDLDEDDDITYSRTGSSKFSVNPTSGAVSLTTQLDRLASPTEQFTIMACDTGSPSRCDSIAVSVTVLDYNDHPPEFVGAPYSRSISECSARADVSILRAIAQDTDDIGPNSEIVYSLLSGDNFVVEEITGVLRTTGDAWDYESGMTSFSGMIRATDNPNGMVRQMADASFTMTLLDCNDNPPVFGSDGRYQRAIAEGFTAANNPILTVSTSDDDTSTQFQSVVYEIVGGTTATNGWIDVDSSGDINVVSPQTIEREHSFVTINSNGQGQITFRVRARNTAPGPSGATLEDEATVTILINDINDNDPIIQNPDIMRVSIVENALNGSIVAVISATDSDYGDNAHISYSIVNGNTGGTFALNPESGHLTVAVQENLDHERLNSFILTIRAENDRGSPAGTPDEMTMIISLIGTNDHSPIFTMPDSPYTATLREYDAVTNMTGAAANSTVQTLFATDADDDNTAAGQIEYRIVSGNTLNGVKIFEILEPSDGAVYVLRPDLVDFEERSQFDIVIEAYDLVTPISERRQDSAHLIVTILDVNDNIPMFSHSFYNAMIVEEQDVGTEAMVIPSIRASDADMDGLTTLRFRLESGHPFTISLDGTSLTTTARVNRETTTRYDTIVTVSDGMYETSVPLQIDVVDINDNPPRFLRMPAELQVNIPENLAIYPHPDSLIQRVEAMDDDIGNNARITYLLSGGRGNFDIVPTTGQVRLIAPLDRDLIASRYSLNVTATDGTLASWLVFTVIIDNVNDNNPVFTEVAWEGTLNEDAPIGSTVLSTDMSDQLSTFLRITAEDLDPESNVTYFLSPVSASLDLPFRIRLDGYIVTTRALNHEMEERYSFFVQATDGFRPSLDDAPVEVIVGDVNDNRPMFEEPSYTTEVYELTPANAIFLILQANDMDAGANAEIMFSITSVEPPESRGFFNITPVTGGLFATRQVQIGQNEPTTITLEVTATDSGMPPMSMSVPVELNLIDRNTNAPEFDEILYMFSVRENMIDEFVGNTIAMDPRMDVNNIITYEILDNSDGYDNFVIDSETGEIRTAVSLNREDKEMYTLTVSATDSDPNPRTGFTTVVVTVEDENDNSPYFDPPSYPIAISESISPNSTLIRVTAFDNDIGTNAELTYRILSGDRTAFTINNDGEISTVTTLDRETVPSYLLVVEVSDSPQNARTALTNVTITINDVNDNNPKFTVFPSDPVEVYEDTESSSFITLIQATDPDFQLNGIVNYYFQNLTVTQGPFRINRETGVISLRSGTDGRLDRETVDFYELTVVAADLRGLGVNVRTDSRTVQVRVLDVNDNIPVFISTLYEFSIPEAFALNTPFGTVRGNDADIGTNAALYYHLVGDDVNDRANSSCFNQFCIGLLTGEIELTSTLDRETNDLHILTIAVTNNMKLEFNETTGILIDASTGSVSVTVTDTNDQPPVFVESSLFAVVTEEAPFGTTITVLEANDEDTLNGSIVWFEIVTPQVPYLVDRDTGVVTTAGVFTGLSGTLQQVTVRAYDNFGEIPTFTTMGTMSVQVFKTDEQVIITFSRDKEAIEAKIDRIREALERVTGEKITITEVRVERTEAGEVDISGTDVVFFALDFNSGIVINPAVIIRIIDENYGVVEDLFTECKVERIRVNTGAATSAASQVPIWLWVVLGILGAAVICMCCCFLIGCVVERRRSRRWKKKAHGQGTDQFSRMADYNTNPLWMNPYEGLEYTSSTVSTGSEQENSNPLYESQELTIEMFQDDGEEDTRSTGRRRTVKAPPLSIPGPVIKRSDGLYDSQEIEIQMGDEDLDSPDSESDLQVLHTSTPQGLAGKRGGKNKAYYSREDELLDEAVGKSYI